MNVIAESVYDKWLKMLLNFSNDHESVVKACLKVGDYGNDKRRELLINELDKVKGSYEVLHNMLRKRYEASKYDGLVRFVSNLFHIATNIWSKGGHKDDEAARERVSLFVSVLLKKGQLNDTGMKRLGEFFCSNFVEEIIHSSMFDDKAALAGFLKLLNSKISDDDWHFILDHYLKGVGSVNHDERIFFADALGIPGFTELLVNVGKAGKAGKAGGTVDGICRKLYYLYYDGICEKLKVSRRRLIELFVQECTASISKSDEGFEFYNNNNKGKFYSSSPNFDINSLFNDFCEALKKKNVLNVDKGKKEKTNEQLSEKFGDELLSGN